MSNTRKVRKTHGADRRNEWLGMIYIYQDVIDAIVPADTPGNDVQPFVNYALRPVFDRHYEAQWPNAGAVPYVSLYETSVSGTGPRLNIEMSTWPGERTNVQLSAESPRERKGKLKPGQAIN